MRNDLLDDLKRDLAYAVRTLSRTPAFSGVAVATLALGIGATTAIFSVVNAVILRPLPYPDSSRLVRIVETGTGRDGLPGDRLVGVALSDLPALREQSKTLSHVGVYAGSTMTLARRGDAVRVEVTRVSPSLFAMIQARPRLGRSFEPRDEAPGSDQVAILSHSLWLREFGGASDVIGQGLTLDGRSYSIVGVMPGSFEFPDRQTQLWTPYVLGGFALRARIPPIARLADHVSLDAATIEVRAILGQLQTTTDSRSGQSRVELRGVHDHLVQSFRPALKVLAAAVGFVLLIACVNVANLVLARTTSRERELTIRASLGAGRARLIRQLLTETLVLGLAGGLAGSAVAVGGVRILRNLGAILPRRDLAVEIGIPRLQELDVDLRVLIFAVTVAVAAGLLSGLAPALRWFRRQNAEMLRDGTSSADAGFDLMGRHRLHGVLVVIEIAMAMTLLAGGGLLIHSFVNLSRVNPGYDPSNVVTFAVYSSVIRAGSQPPAGQPSAAPSRRETPLDDFLFRLRSLPRVREASYAELLPLVRFRSGVRLRTTPGEAGRPPAPPAPGTQSPPDLPDTRIVHRDYLNAMGMRVIEGRTFGDDDTEGRPKVMLINRTLARSGFLGSNPVGTRVYAAGKAPWEIVGIVEDVRQYGLDQKPEPQVFIDARQLPLSNPNPYFVVRSDGNPVALLSDIRHLAKQSDPDAVVDNIATMDQLLANSLSRPRFYAVVLGLFAAAAAGLAAIGIYGVMAYAVARRTREIGIRMALGARPREVLDLVLRQSVVLTGLGIFIGLCGALMVGRRLEGMLFGLNASDPFTLVVMSLLFAFVAAIAAVVPAARATRVDPVTALRTE
jgi:putative ABC transport system permease protein